MTGEIHDSADARDLGGADPWDDDPSSDSRGSEPSFDNGYGVLADHQVSAEAGSICPSHPIVDDVWGGSSWDD